MNESRQESLLQKLQYNQLSDRESGELMQWLDMDETRMAAFAHELRMSNSLAALCVLDSDCIAPAVIDSLSRRGVAADISKGVRRQLEMSLSQPPSLVIRSQRSSLK